jgi:hypothetical protein
VGEFLGESSAALKPVTRREDVHSEAATAEVQRPSPSITSPIRRVIRPTREASGLSSHSRPSPISTTTSATPNPMVSPTIRPSTAKPSDVRNPAWNRAPSPAATTAATPPKPPSHHRANERLAGAGFSSMATTSSTGHSAARGRAEPGRGKLVTRRETYMSTRHAAIGSSRSSESGAHADCG